MKQLLVSLAVVALGSSSVGALTAYRAASLNVEAERTAQGARLSFTGKGFNANARVKLTGTRAPGAQGQQDFGTVSADASGGFKYQKVAPCTTQNMEEARDPVTITATDSASSAAVTKKVESGAWVCQ